MISGILIESGLIDVLRTIGPSKNLTAIQRVILNAHTLKRMQLIEEVTTPSTMFPDILTRRTPVVGFSHMFKEDLDKSVKRYLKSCVKAQTSVDPALIRGR